MKTAKGKIRHDQFSVHEKNDLEDPKIQRRHYSGEEKVLACRELTIGHVNWFSWTMQKLPTPRHRKPFPRLSKAYLLRYAIYEHAQMQKNEQFGMINKISR